MENLQPRQPRRIMLWAHQRSLSTAFELSLASRQKTKVFHELYTMAYYYGDERTFENKIASVPGYTFKNAIELLEADYPGKDVIFCKDMALCLDGKYDRLAKGYIHTFLIRDPRQSIASVCKARKVVNAPLLTFPPTGGVKQVYELHNYVTSTLNQQSIIIDASDLANQPEKIIRKYCEAVEIPYCDSYLNWKPNNIGHWPAIWTNTLLRVYFESAVESTHFKPTLNKDNPVDMSDLPHHAQLQVQAALPYYSELFEKRLKP
ncbi:uncharacterized protein [Ptychodera flava]|uniref:uncharacterized protein n=1 Tax=Ptychodera flava TaxID=63121 RepID=UPI003969D232